MFLLSLCYDECTNPNAAVRFKSHLRWLSTRTFFLRARTRQGPRTIRLETTLLCIPHLTASAVNQQLLAYRRIGTHINRLSRAAAQVAHFFIVSGDRVRHARVSRQRDEVAFADRLVLDLGRALLARLDDVHPFFVLAVPVHDGALRVRWEVDEVDAEFGETGDVTERDRLAYESRF